MGRNGKGTLIKERMHIREMASKREMHIFLFIFFILTPRYQLNIGKHYQTLRINMHVLHILPILHKQKYFAI